MNHRGGSTVTKRRQRGSFLNVLGKTINREGGCACARPWEQHVRVVSGGRGGAGGPAEYLQDYLLVYRKLGDNVGQQQVPAVLAGGVHAGLGEQAGPREGHEAAQLAVAVLVVVVDVVGCVLHQQRGKLQQVDAQRVQHVRLLLRVQDLREHEHRMHCCSAAPEGPLDRSRP